MLRSVLGLRFALVPYDDCVQVLTALREHLALIDVVTGHVDVQLSVVLPAPTDDEETLGDWASVADRLMRSQVLTEWQEAGFELPETGTLVASEVIDDPEQVVWSYELPIQATTGSVAEMAATLLWVAEQSLQWILWDLEGPIGVLS